MVKRGKKLRKHNRRILKKAMKRIRKNRQRLVDNPNFGTQLSEKFRIASDAGPWRLVPEPEITDRIVWHDDWPTLYSSVGRQLAGVATEADEKLIAEFLTDVKELENSNE